MQAMNRFNLIRTMALTAGACLAGTAVPGFAHSAVDRFSTEDVEAHATVGCGGAIVLTPRPGHSFKAATYSTTGTATDFYEQAAQRQVTWLSTMDCRHTNRSHELIPFEGAGSDASSVRPMVGYTSSNWSGYQISNVAQYVQAGWTVPTVKGAVPSYSSNGYYSSTWTGIGGGYNSGSGPLIQSGTSQDTVAPGYYAWYEIVGGPTNTRGEVMVGNLPVHPGDAVGSAQIWNPSTSSTSSPGIATMGVCNFTIGKCLNFVVPNTPQPGTSVEWIVEAPMSSFVLPLANFNVVNFINGCWAPVYVAGVTTQCNAITAGTALSNINLFTYVFKKNQLNAYPDGMTSANSFTDVYEAPSNNSN